jgi:3-oxoacyl-[acyl-carrier protein] reductase
MGELTGKVAIVTGASKGIGAGIAKGLAAAGAAVVVNYASSKEGADRVVADITGKGGKAIAVKADVSKATDVRRLFDETKKAFGSLDVLVNNAGVYQFAPLEEVTEDEFHREFNTNVLGLLLATKEAMKHFGPDGGSVINISSMPSMSPTPTAVVYSGPKVRSTRSRACWRRSWDQRKSGSTRSIRAASRPRARIAWGSSAATSKSN